MIPDVETQFEELTRELEYWKAQAKTLRIRNETLQRENRILQGIVNVEYGIDG